MSANDHEQHERRGLGVNPVGMILCAATLYLASAGPFVGIWMNSMIPYRIGEKVWFTVYAPIAWAGVKTDFFHENPIGQAYTAYADWWIDAMK